MDLAEYDLYKDYYLAQAGDGFNVYNGALYQRGYGLGK